MKGKCGMDEGASILRHVFWQHGLKACRLMCVGHSASQEDGELGGSFVSEGDLPIRERATA